MRRDFTHFGALPSSRLTTKTRRHEESVGSGASTGKLVFERTSHRWVTDEHHFFVDASVFISVHRWLNLFRCLRCESGVG